MAGCGPSSGNPKVPAGATSSGGMHGVIDTDKGAIEYVIFARVTAGMDVVDALADTPTAMGADGGMSRPLTPPVIKKVTIRP